jgi:hypothetical protein
VVVSVQARLGPEGAAGALPGARLYLLDDRGKIKVERVLFFVEG